MLYSWTSQPGQQMQQHRDLHFTRTAQTRAVAQRISQEGLRVATLLGDRFVQPDGTVMHLVTHRAVHRACELLGLRPAYAESALQGVFVIMSRSGRVMTMGRRWAGDAGRIRRS